MMMRPTEFIAKIMKSQWEPVYFFSGPDRLMHEECRSALVNSLPADARAWCLAEIEFEPGSLENALEGARQMPMLGGRNVLIFSDPEDFKRAGDGDLKALEGYLARPSSFATVVFAASRPDRRRKFIQLIEKKAALVAMLPLPLAEAARWAQAFFRRAEVELPNDLAAELAARFEVAGDDPHEAGVNALWMRTEMEKLLVARPGMKQLAREDLDFIVAGREEHEIGKMLRALAERNFPAAVEYLRALLAAKASEVLILWSVAELLRQAIQGSPAQSYGYGAWGGRANPLAIPAIAPIARRSFSRPELLRALKFVRAADLALKSSWKDSRLLLEVLVWQVVTGEDAAPEPAGASQRPSEA